MHTQEFYIIVTSVIHHLWRLWYVISNCRTYGVMCSNHCTRHAQRLVWDRHRPLLPFQI